MTEYWKLCSQRKECVSELFFEFRENVPGGHTIIFTDSRGSSRLLNTLEERLCRGGTERARVVEYSESSTRWALSRCKCAQVNSISSSERREVSREDTPELLNTLVKQTGEILQSC
jgi:hypothetical protein